MKPKGKEIILSIGTVGLAKHFILAFLYDHMEKPEWTFWPTNSIYGRLGCAPVIKFPRESQRLHIGKVYFHPLLYSQWVLHVCMLSCFSHVWLLVTPWTIIHQAPFSMGFFKQECWCQLPFPPPEYHSDPRIKPTSLVSPALQAADSLPAEPPGTTSGVRGWERIVSGRD